MKQFNYSRTSAQLSWSASNEGPWKGREWEWPHFRLTVSCRASPSPCIVKMHGRSSACPLRQNSQALSLSLDLMAMATSWATSCTAFRCSASAWVSQAAVASPSFVGLRLGQSSHHSFPFCCRPRFPFSCRPPLGSVKPQLPLLFSGSAWVSQAAAASSVHPLYRSRLLSGSALYSLTSSRVFVVLRPSEVGTR